MQARLKSEYGQRYLASPWLRFTDEAGQHWCQPDGLLHTPTGVIIIEVKYQHTVDAYNQLRLLYEPVVSVLIPESRLSVLEVVKWYDCDLVFPEPARLIRNIDEHSGHEFGVHIWKP